MNRVQRPSRAASDFSIARILADDHTRKSRVHSPTETVGQICNDDEKRFPQRDNAEAMTGNANSFGSSKNDAKWYQNPSFGSDSLLDRINISSVHDPRSVASSLQLPRSIGDCKTLRVETGELSWLQCTRYRPPKLLRKSVSGKSGKRRPGAHPRIPFTASQLQILEDKYRKTAYLSRRDVIQLSALLRLPQSRVKIWFQNRRARDRRETSISGGDATNLSADAPSARISRGIPSDNSTAPNAV